ncbi:MAG: DUF456 domain-containing protein [Thermodesulfobacteriota bacterium]|nr:DUF456 domain-containing protein [Thermodesulfobacteriota bacterium]
MIEVIAIIIGSILILFGLVGSILPVLPGPPFSFVGLLLLALVSDFSPPLTSTLVVTMGIVTVVVTGVDYVIPLFGAKRYGASKWGVWGSVVGMAIGIFWSPFGLLLGAFAGAVFAEWLVHKKKGQALRAGWGVVVGTLLGTILKLGISGMMAYYFVRALL